MIYFRKPSKSKHTYTYNDGKKHKKNKKNITIAT